MDQACKASGLLVSMAKLQEDGKGNVIRAEKDIGTCGTAKSCEFYV